MLQTFYENFGFFGALILSLGLFSFFIFWIAGIAGISQLPDSKSKLYKLVVGAIIPPYPIIWLIIDIFRQRKRMQTDIND